MTLSLMACAHDIGGKNIDDVFSNTQTRQLAQAACRGDTNTIRKLVGSGADVNAPGLDGLSVLMWALSCNNVEGMKALLDAGADPNHKVKNNLNPVSIAATYIQSTKFLEVLIAAGGNVNAVSGNYEETALMKAFMMGHNTGNWNNYYYLLDAGADINQITNNGYSVGFRAAAFNENCKIIELIDRGLIIQLDKLLRRTNDAPNLIKESDQHRCRGPLIEKLEARIAELGHSIP